MLRAVPAEAAGFSVLSQISVVETSTISLAVVTAMALSTVAEEAVANLPDQPPTDMVARMRLAIRAALAAAETPTQVMAALEAVMAGMGWLELLLAEAVAVVRGPVA